MTGGVSSSDESQRDEGSSSSASKDSVSIVTMKFFLCVNNSTLKMRMLREEEVE